MSTAHHRVIVLGAVVAGLLTLRAIAGLGNKPDTRSPVANLYDPTIPGVVCGGTPWTLDEATTAMPFQLQFPHHALADAPQLKQVWKCSDIDVALEFSSGVVIYEGVNTLADPAAVWRRMAELYPEFSVGTVRGTLASLADPTKADGAEGGVNLVDGNARIIVSGDGEIPLVALLEVAESLNTEK